MTVGKTTNHCCLFYVYYVHYFSNVPNCVLATPEKSERRIVKKLAIAVLSCNPRGAGPLEREVYTNLVY